MDNPSLVKIIKNRREWLTIQQLELNYTTEMEKAMYLSHRIGYEEYSCTLAKRLEIEKKRQQNYIASRQMISEIERRSFHHN
ncbi:hypothetical protein [Bacillus pinisoli]|uniref:hypothetical protein n=1 Tax=Bacillus pinisoli TaxID=2901866 RepID=UPI001FF1C454|nr:hypothetical protein [Bacillus pinisoli]